MVGPFRVLVTGIDGFTGQYVANVLSLQSTIKEVVFCLTPGNSASLPGKLSVVAGDVVQSIEYELVCPNTFPVQFVD